MTRTAEQTRAAVAAEQRAEETADQVADRVRTEEAALANGADDALARRSIDLDLDHDPEVRERLYTERKLDQDAMEHLFIQLAQMERKAQAQGHSLADILAKGARDAFGIDIRYVGDNSADLAD